MKLLQYIHLEWIHFYRNKYKVLAYIIFLLVAVYGLQNGHRLRQQQLDEISKIEISDQDLFETTVGWYNEFKKGPEEKLWVDITQPYWASIYASPTLFKTPSPLLFLSSGQSEHYGFYKKADSRSSALDSDLVGAITNPERLTIGTLDFSFVFLYIMPLLMVILLFNLGGLESDDHFYPLIQIQANSPTLWLASRYAFYGLLLIASVWIMTIFYALTTKDLCGAITSFLTILFLLIGYTFFWLILFFVIQRKKKGSAVQAIKMISIWLLFCLVIPGLYQQRISQKYPAHYMTEFLDANRHEKYKLYSASSDSLAEQLYILYPELADYPYAKNTDFLNSQRHTMIDALANNLNKEAISAIQKIHEEKNRAIEKSYVFNPILFFQNKLSHLTASDYYAYNDYQKAIQQQIDKKIQQILNDGWAIKIADKALFKEYYQGD